MLARRGIVLRAASTAVLALSALADSALAQRAERPGVKVGDQWQFVVYYGTPSMTPNRTWVISTVTPARIEGTENGAPLLLNADLNVIDSPRESNSNPTNLRFPLAVGDHWSYATDWLFKSKRSTGRSVVDVLVVGHEKVSVVAGEFDAFKLEAKSRLSGISGINSRIDAEASATYWYAPTARAIVKAMYRNPYLGPSTVELVAFKLQP